MTDKNKISTPEENFSFLVNELIEQGATQQKFLNDLLTASNTSIKKANDLEDNIGKTITEGFQKLEQTLNKKLDALKESQQPTDDNLVMRFLKNSFHELKSILIKRQEGQSRKIQLLLFPEQDAKLFYKIVFGRWFLMVVIALFLQIVYNIISRQQQINKEIRMEELKHEPVLKAWNYLYSQKNKTLQRLMDSAVLRASAQ